MPRELAVLYRQLHRPAEAIQHAQAALRWVRSDGAWWPERNILLELGQLARFRKQGALARALPGRRCCGAPSPRRSSFRRGT